MEFSLFSYSQKRILAAGVLSLLSGYVIGVVNIPRGSLTHILSPSWVSWCRYIRGSSTTDCYTDFGAFLMVLINIQLLIGASVGSVASIFVEKHFGKVKAISLAYLSFGFGSLLCLSKEIAIFSTGRAICGFGVGISCNIVPSYIFELTNKQNQTLFSTLHNVLFCCGILMSYVLSMVTVRIVSYINNLRNPVISIKSSNHIISPTVGQDSSGIILRNNLDRLYEASIEQSIKDVSFSNISVQILFIIPILISVVLSIIWFLRLNTDTPSRYIRLNNIRAAEEVTRQIYGAYDTTRIISQLIEENKRENKLTIKLLKAISESPSCDITTLGYN
ncbi:sugar transporter [Cryptosporidium canis]|nr:sugar transporter [Cryptosporidium canis]